MNEPEALHKGGKEEQVKIAKIGVLITALVISAFQPASAEWTGATADEFISSLASQSGIYCPSFAVGPNNELYAVWAQRESGSPIRYELYFSKSTDNGDTWTGVSGDQRINANDGDGVYNGGISGARRTDIVVDSEGRIFVFWPENYVSASFDTTVEIMNVMSVDGGTTWIHSDTDFPVSDTLSPNIANSPNAAVDLNDNIHVVWNQTEPGSGFAEIGYSVSTDHGLTWSARAGDRFISNINNHSSASPDIAVDVDNKIHVIWREFYTSSDYRLEYGVSTDGGVTFSSESSDSVISYSPSIIAFPRIVAGPNSGELHTIYSWGNTAVYVGTVNGGSSWTQTTIFVGISYNMNGPDIGVTSTGTIVAIIDDQYPGTENNQVYASYSSDNGATWSVTLDPVSHYETAPQFDRTYIPTLGITSDDVLHCVYATNTNPSSNSYQEMAYSRNSSIGPQPGKIAGTITELDGTTPIENVAVTIYDGGNPVGSATSSSSGYYEVPLSAGTYSAAYHIYTHHDTTISDIDVENDMITTVDVSLTPYALGTISGTVYEETGTYPLSQVAVEALDQFMVVWATDTTSTSGTYSLMLLPGTYSVHFSALNFEDLTVPDQAVTEGGSINLDVNMNWAIPADDIGAVSLDDPVDYLIVSNSYDPAVSLENLGYQDQIIDLNMVITNEGAEEVYNQTETGIAVDSLGTAQAVFSTAFVPAAAGDYTFTATVINPGDENTGNDILVSVLTAYAHQGTGGPDGYGYQFIDNTVEGGPQFNWLDISGTGTQIEPTLHYFMSDELALGFDINFYGSTYNTMYVNSHGSLHLGIHGVWSMDNDCPIPNPDTPNAPIIMPFWDGKEIRYEVGQGVYYQYFDEPETDYTVVQWNASNYGYDNSLEFEAILYQDGHIVFQYNLVDPNVPSGQGQMAAVGLEYDIPPDLYGISYLCDDDNPANRLVDGLAIGFYAPASSAYPYLPGDANMYNGTWPPTVIGSDVTYLVSYFRGLVTNPACLLDGFYAAADVNASCTVIGSDVTRLVSYFRGSANIEYCLDYEPLWHNGGELPQERPAGWPPCNPQVVIGKVVPGGSSTR